VLILCCLRQADLWMRILRSGMCARVLVCLCVIVCVYVCLCVCRVSSGFVYCVLERGSVRMEYSCFFGTGHIYTHV